MTVYTLINMCAKYIYLFDYSYLSFLIIKYNLEKFINFTELLLIMNLIQIFNWLNIFELSFLIMLLFAGLLTCLFVHLFIELFNHLSLQFFNHLFVCQINYLYYQNFNPCYNVLVTFKVF